MGARDQRGAAPRTNQLPPPPQPRRRLNAGKIEFCSQQPASPEPSQSAETKLEPIDSEQTLIWKTERRAARDTRGHTFTQKRNPGKIYNKRLVERTTFVHSLLWALLRQILQFLLKFTFKCFFTLLVDRNYDLLMFKIWHNLCLKHVRNCPYLIQYFNKTYI